MQPEAHCFRTLVALLPEMLQIADVTLSHWLRFQHRPLPSGLLSPRPWADSGNTLPLHSLPSTSAERDCSPPRCLYPCALWESHILAYSCSPPSHEKQGWETGERHPSSPVSFIMLHVLSGMGLPNTPVSQAGVISTISHQRRCKSPHACRSSDWWYLALRQEVWIC